MKKYIVPKRSVKEIAYDKLKKMIIHHELQPNEEIREEALAESLLVSRTPLRAAIQELIAEELLVRQKNGRLSVADITKERVQEIFQLRALLEGYAARVATAKICEEQIAHLQSLNNELASAFYKNDSEYFVTVGNEFHEYIWWYSELHTTLSMLSKIKSHIERFCYYVSVVDQWDESSISEHENILEAFKKKDAALAEELMKQHIHNSLVLLLSKMEVHNS